MGPVALLHNPRLSRVVTLCVLGVVGCGVSLALAGPTPRPPADPLDALPADLKRPRDWPCAADLASAVAPTVSMTEAPGPTEPEPCWRIALVSAEGETANQLADRLAKVFTGKGFEFTGRTTGDFRALTGTLAQCGTTMTIDTGYDAALLPPGTRANMPTGSPTGGNGIIPVPPSGTGAGEPAVSTVPGASSSTVPGGASSTMPAQPGPTASVVTDGFASPNQPVDPDALEQGAFVNPTTLLANLQPDQKGSVVMVASQQARAVVPRALEGRC
jgi:hypothetical protein